MQELVGGYGSPAAVLLAAAASHLQHHQQLLDADGLRVKRRCELRTHRTKLHNTSPVFGQVSLKNSFELFVGSFIDCSEGFVQLLTIFLNVIELS